MLAIGPGTPQTPAGRCKHRPLRISRPLHQNHTPRADGTAYETATDDFGDFWFKDLPETTASVTIRAEGYRPRTFDGLDTTQCPNLGDVPLEKEQVSHCG